MYQNYVFDLYGTLVDVKTNPKNPYVWKKMAELMGFYGAFYEAGELKKKYFQKCREMEAELSKKEAYPEIDVALVFRSLLDEKGAEDVKQSDLEALLKALRVLTTKYLRLYEGVPELLKLLKEKNKKVYLLSNAQREFTRPELKYLKIEHYFDDILISSEEGCKKPGESFYRRLMEKHSLKPEETIMIGNDSIADIEGAYNVGMNSLYIHTAISPECVEDLKSTYTIMDGDFKKIRELVVAH